MRSALCAMLYALCPQAKRSFCLLRFCLPPQAKRSFCLMLYEDAWSMILRVCEIVKNRDLTPDDKVFGGELETIIQEINKAIAA